MCLTVKLFVVAETERSATSTQTFVVLRQCSPGHILTFFPNTDFDISLICLPLLSFYGALKLKFCIHLSCHFVCTVCSVLFSWFEPSKRTAGGVLSFFHDNWYLPARLFRQRTALNAARTTNWETFGGGGGYLTTSLVSKTTERQWQMNKMSAGHSWNSRAF